MDTMQFITCVLRNAARIRGYKLGHDGTDGYSDCIGLIVGALKLGGIAWPGINGTNYTERYLVDDLKKGNALMQGDLVFKAKAPGEEGYDLPSRYADSADRLDYYHVGVVLSVHPLRIIHCSARGIQMDDSRGSWQYSGWLKLIQRGMGTMVQAVVTAQSGSTVNMRKGPGLEEAVILRVPVGSTVQVLEETNVDWARISFDGKEGYMMRQFLDLQLPPEDIRYEQIVILRKQIDAILQAAKAANDALDQLIKE